MKDGLIITLLSIIPKKPTARFMGFTARLRFPSFMNRAFLRAFVWKYNINMEESVSKIEDFNSLSDLFLRKLKPKVRVIEQEPNIATSPVDGTIHSFGPIVDGTFAQSKELKGLVSNLIGSQEESQNFQNGSYMIIYLSPQDYHRVHCHDGGTLRELQYQPGKLWPVFPAATRKIPHLFDRNERLVFHIEHFERGNIQSVLSMIGAFGVGRMTTDWNPVITNNYEPKQDITILKSIQRGDELGRFELGSTVVLFFQPDQIVKWGVEEGQKVQLGQPIADLVT